MVCTFLSSCFSPQENNNQVESKVPISESQSDALDALNILQTNIDGQHLYSTFPNLNHDFMPCDSTVIISRDELRKALNEIISKYGSPLTESQRQEVINDAILAEDQYWVSECALNQNSFIVGTNIRVWLIQNLLNRRDVVIIW